ncbi:MAG TPA: energy transducer TonB [Gemmatimonadaceae bacterium]|nr:energy transducer TonB [Gemmatimonadaceae bacterium]
MERESPVRVIGRWYEAFRETRIPPAAVIVSVAAHVVLLGAFVDASGPPPAGLEEPSFRPVFYLAPPNRPVTEMGGGERIRYVALGSGGTGSGPGEAVGSEEGTARPAIPTPGERGDDAGFPAPIETDEPVFTVIEVDEEAARVATSAAPAYPARLLSEGIEGTVLVRYVVEANGLADSSSLEILSATRREFADAVRAAIPHMRFTPARIDERPVRQLVEQPFSFRIARAPPEDTSGTPASSRNP